MTGRGATDRSLPAEIERDIAQTRTALGATLDALDRRLAPRHLMEKGLAMLKESSTYNEGLNRGLEAIRANPVPVALIGLGAAWLLANNTSVIERAAPEERIETVRERAAALASDAGPRAGQLASNVADRVGLGESDSRSDAWMHQMTGMAQGAFRTARESGGAMLHRMNGYAGGELGRIADRLSETFQRNPLLVGAIGVMAGALIAMLLPPRRTGNGAPHDG